MKAVLVLAFFGFVVAQWPNQYQHDRIHGYSFDYHSYADLMVVTNSTTCVLVNLHDKEHEMRELNNRYEIEDNIYQQLLKGAGEHRTTLSEIRREYHDIYVIFECFRKRVYEVTYADPSS